MRSLHWLSIAMVISFISIESKSQVIGCGGKPFDPSLKYGFYRMAFIKDDLLKIPNVSPGFMWVYSSFALYGVNPTDPTPNSGLLTEVRLEKIGYEPAAGLGTIPVYISVKADGVENLFLLNESFKENGYYRMPLGDGIKFCKSINVSIAVQPISGSYGTLMYYNAFASWRTVY